MMSAPVLVTGGNGRLGQAVLRQLGDRGVAGVRQSTRQGNAVLVGSGGVVEPHMLRDFNAIINCAGRVDGSPDSLKEANVAYPLALARAARAAGLSRFIHVSSFSVFGRAELVDANSVLAPIDIYGHSKLEAEQRLLAETAMGFKVLPVRLPFMFSAIQPGLLGRMVSIMLRLRVLPSPIGRPVRRSMITYAGAAAALIARLDGPDGTAVAADPCPLSLVEISQAITQHLGVRIFVLPVPSLFTTVVESIAPQIANRLFRSSVLDPSVNMIREPTRHAVRDELIEYLNLLCGDGVRRSIT